MPSLFLLHPEVVGCDLSHIWSRNFPAGRTAAQVVVIELERRRLRQHRQHRLQPSQAAAAPRALAEEGFSGCFRECTHPDDRDLLPNQ